MGFQIDHGKYIPFRAGKTQPVSLDTSATELALDRNISHMMLCHFFRDLVFVCISPHGALVIIHIFIISTAYTKMSVPPVHGYAGSIHFCTDIIALYLFECFDQLRIRLNSQLVGLWNIPRESACHSTVGDHSLTYFPFSDTQDLRYIITDLVISFRQDR